MDGGLPTGFTDPYAYIRNPIKQKWYGTKIEPKINCLWDIIYPTFMGKLTLNDFINQFWGNMWTVFWWFDYKNIDWYHEYFYGSLTWVKTIWEGWFPPT